MPLTEINVTNPPPIYPNYWRDREAARAAAPPPPPWPAIDPGLLEEGRSGLPAFPLKVFPHQWRGGGGGPPPPAGPAGGYVARAPPGSPPRPCGRGGSARPPPRRGEPGSLWWGRG